jgi:hypothetical protein
MSDNSKPPEFNWLDLSKPPPPREWRPERWGPWEIHCNGFEGVPWALYHPGHGYVIGLNHLCRSSVVLDLIHQVAKKQWADDTCLAGLVRALCDILDPQGNLCGGGKDKHFPTESITKRITAWASRKIQEGLGEQQ